MTQPSFGLLAVVVLARTAGDILTQRCMRVVHRGNYRRFLCSTSLVNVVQIFIAISILVASAEQDTAWFRTSSSPTAPSARLLPTAFDFDHCDPCATAATAACRGILGNATFRSEKYCFAQTAGTLFRLISMAPVLLTMLILAAIQSFAAAVLLKHSTNGVVVIAIAVSVAEIVDHSSELVDDQKKKAVAVILSISGALLLCYERRPDIALLMSRRRRQAQLREHNNINININEQHAMATTTSMVGDDISTQTAAGNNIIINGGNDDDYDPVFLSQATEDDDNLPINDEGFRRGPEDAPMSLWDTVDRVALDVETAHALRVARESANNARGGDNAGCCCCCCCCCSCCRECVYVVFLCAVQAVKNLCVFARSLVPFASLCFAVGMQLLLVRRAQQTAPITPLSVVGLREGLATPVACLVCCAVFDLMCCSCMHRPPTGAAPFARGHIIVMNRGHRQDHEENFFHMLKHTFSEWLWWQYPQQQQQQQENYSGALVEETQSSSSSSSSSSSWFSCCCGDSASSTGSFCGRGFLEVFLARAFANAAVLGGAWIVQSSANRDATQQQQHTAESCLLHVLLAWLVVYVLNFFAPCFLKATAAERRAMRLPGNVCMKVAGSVLVIVAVFLSQKKI